MSRQSSMRWPLQVALIAAAACSAANVDSHAYSEQLWGSRRFWSLDWMKVGARQADVTTHYYNPVNGKLIFYDQMFADGWRPDFRPLAQTYRGGQAQGLNQVAGHAAESGTMIFRDAGGFVGLLKEHMNTEIYCRGARAEASFMNSFIDMAGGHKAEDTQCVASCLKVALGAADTATPDAVTPIPRLLEATYDGILKCHIPIVRSYHSRFLETITHYGPSATIHLPPNIFDLAQVNDPKDLTEFLVHVQILKCPGTGFNRRSVLRVQVDDVEGEKGTKHTAAAYKPPSRLERERLAVRATCSPPNNTAYEGRQVNDIFSPANPMGSCRPANNSFNYFDFQPTDSKQAPRFWIAPTAHYGAYPASSFNGPTVQGPLVSDPVVVKWLEHAGEASYIVDIAPALRRYWNSGFHSFALVSTCSIGDIKADFGIRKAVQWLYQPQGQNETKPGFIDCSSYDTCDACRAKNCTWCRRLTEPEDYWHLEWRNISKPHYDGRCGVPPGVCDVHYGRVGNEKIC